MDILFYLVAVAAIIGTILSQLILKIQGKLKLNQSIPSVFYTLLFSIYTTASLFVIEGLFENYTLSFSYITTLFASLLIISLLGFFLPVFIMLFKKLHLTFKIYTFSLITSFLVTLVLAVLILTSKTHSHSIFANLVAIVPFYFLLSNANLANLILENSLKEQKLTLLIINLINAAIGLFMVVLSLDLVKEQPFDLLLALILAAFVLFGFVGLGSQLLALNKGKTK